jgi:hypothetical protein
MVVYLDTKVEKDPGRLVSEESHVCIGEPKGGQLIAECRASLRAKRNGTRRT